MLRFLIQRKNNVRTEFVHPEKIIEKGQAKLERYHVLHKITFRDAPDTDLAGYPDNLKAG
jgi:hypothetical protein